MTVLQAPEKARSRDQASELLSEWTAGSTVVVDASGVFVATPSFADGLLKSALLNDEERILVVLDPPQRFADKLRRAAERLQVSSRLVIK